MKRSELRQMIQEEYKAALNEAADPRWAAMEAARKEMVKSLNAFNKAALKVDKQLKPDDKKLIMKFEQIDKRMNDIFEYLGDAYDLIKQGKQADK